MDQRDFNSFVDTTLDYVNDVTRTLTSLKKQAEYRTQKEAAAKQLAKKFCEKAASVRLDNQPLLKTQKQMDDFAHQISTHEGALKVAAALLTKYVEAKKELSTEKAASVAREPGKATSKQASVDRQPGVRYRELSALDKLWMQVNEN